MQRQVTPLEMIKLPTSLSAEKALHAPSKDFLAPETDVETRSVREGSVTTDDSVRCLYD